MLNLPHQIAQAKQAKVCMPCDWSSCIQSSKLGAETHPFISWVDAQGMEERQKEKRFWAIKFGVACIFSIPVFLLSMVFANIGYFKSGLDTNVGGFTWGELVKWALTTPVQVRRLTLYCPSGSLMCTSCCHVHCMISEVNLLGKG